MAEKKTASKKGTGTKNGTGTSGEPSKKKIDWGKFERIFAPVEVEENGKTIEKENRFSLPRRWNGRDFYGDLHKLLDDYLEKLEENYSKDETDALYKKTEDIVRRVLEIVRIYLHGYPAEAYERTRALMEELEKQPMYANPRNIGKLYRMTEVSENINDRARIFHVPYDLRQKIRTWRYSIAGYPGLYLAESLELAEAEMGVFKDKRKALAARFELDSKSGGKIIEFGFRPQDFFAGEGEGGEDDQSKRSSFKKSIMYSEEYHVKRNKPAKGPAIDDANESVESGLPAPERYMLWYPLIAACSYVRVNREDAFAPEYIVPQLITQWLRQGNTGELVGIRYFSCYSKHSAALGMNYAFPTSGDPLLLKSGVKQYCPVLNEAFVLTEPEYIPEYKDRAELEGALEGKQTARAFPLTSEEYADKTEVELPNGLMYLAPQSFAVCDKLKSVVFPNGLTSIGWGAFLDCTSLTKIELRDGLISIGGWAFAGCTSLTKIELPDGLTSIGGWAFAGCTSLKKIELRDGLTSIGWRAFEGCTSLKEIELRDGLTSIGARAFAGCTSLSKIELPDGLTSIGACAFGGCTSLNKIELPDGLTSIGGWAFEGCTSLKEIELPDGLTSIGACAFEGCTSLKEIELRDGLTSIGGGAFEGCTSLKTICFAGTMEQWQRIEKADAACFWGAWDADTPDYTVRCSDGELSKAEARINKK